MSKVAVKAELVSAIFTLVQTEADMPRTKAALSDALRVGAEEMTSQITNGMIDAVKDSEARNARGPRPQAAGCGCRAGAC
jgi:hypothetical protein